MRYVMLAVLVIGGIAAWFELSKIHTHMHELLFEVCELQGKDGCIHKEAIRYEP